MSTEAALPVLTARDFESDQYVRWCPGCGDYSILAQVKKVLPTLGIPRENFVFVSGIGCSSRFPYYVDTYGFHSIHGRAPTLATGIKINRPELSVWVATGDGDGLSIGGNHLLHAMRRNVDIKILLFNNRIYGLTKGQYSPTSLTGAVTKSSPGGAVDYPIYASSVAIGAECTFVARTIDRDVKHLQMILKRAAQHKGTAFVEIYQNCHVFNDGAWDYTVDKAIKAEHTIYLEQNKPLIFGKDRDKGIRLNGLDPEIVQIADGVSEDDLLFHDEKAQEPSLAFLLTRLRYPEFPEAIGVFRDIQRPTYDGMINEQVESAKRKGTPDFQALIQGTETWTVQ